MGDLYKLSWFEKLFMKKIVKKVTRQGNQDMMVSLFKDIRVESQKTYNEENTVTTDCHLKECLDKAITSQS
jgi:hypothetical protein